MEPLYSRLLKAIQDDNFEEEESTVSKIQESFGKNEKMYDILKFADYWLGFNFQMSSEALQKTLSVHNDGKLRFNFVDPNIEDLPEKFASFDVSQQSHQEISDLNTNHESTNNLSIKVDSGAFHTIRKDESTAIGEIESSCTRNSIVLNAGGLITTMNWISYGVQNVNSRLYLLIGVVNKITPELQLFDENLAEAQSVYDTDYVSFLKIFQLNTDTQKLSLATVWVFRGLGPLKQIKNVVRNKSADTQIGILFGDGVLRIMDFNAETLARSGTVTKFAKSITLPRPHKITCFDFLDCDRVVFGTNCGYLGAFELTDLEEPVFFLRKRSYAIVFVIAQPKIAGMCNDLILVNGLDKSMIVVDYEYPERHKYRDERLSFNSVRYVPALLMFSFNFNNNVRAFPLHNLKDQSQNVARHLANTKVTAFEHSWLHPFMLSSSNDGELLFSNMANFHQSLLRSKTFVYPQLKLWKLEYNESTANYKLSSDLYPRELRAKLLPQKEHKETLSPIDKNTLKGLDYVTEEKRYELSAQTLFAPQMNFGHISWCQCVNGFNWYAAANAYGLVVIDRIGLVEDPVSL